MGLKIMSFIFAISLAFGSPLTNQVKDRPFDVNEVINQVSSHRSSTANPRSPIPDLFGEFLIDTNIVYIPNADNQMSPSIAFDGTNYLVVWDDDRIRGDWDIFGVRVNQAGEILDLDGFIISHAPNDQQFSGAAFDGTNYLVVWQDERSDEFYDIYGARVTPAGTVLDPGGFAISTALYDQLYPRLTFDGTNYLVVWQDMRQDDWGDIFGARVNQAGVLIDTNGIAITVAPDSQGSPSVTSSGGNNFVVWHDNRNGNVDIYGSRVNYSGVVLDTAGIAISTATHEQGYPSVAFDGTNYFVVWDDYRLRTRGIYGARVTQDGIVLDTNGVSVSMASMDRIRPSVNFDGSNYFIVWQDYRNNNWDIYGARVNQVGVVLDSAGIAISTVTYDQRRPVLAFDGTNYFVVWEDFRSNFNWDIYCSRVSQDGLVFDTSGILLSHADVHQQSYPSVAFDGTNYLVVWQDYRKGYYDSDIYCARVNSYGVPIDPVSKPVSTALGIQNSSSVTYGGTNYFAVWEDWYNAHIYGARLNQEGIVLDTNGIIISSSEFGQRTPSVACDGINYLVVWGDDRGTSTDLYCARVNQDGIVIDSNGIALSIEPCVQADPSIAFDGTNYFVVWRDRRRVADTSDIYGARINQSGVVLDPEGIAITTVPGEQKSPCVAFDGTNYLVAWQDYRNGRTSDIYGALVDQEGVVLESGFIISADTNYQMYPSAVFDGTNYVVVWEDNRNVSSYDIYGAKINRQGTVIDTFPVSIQPGDQTSPKIAKGIANQLLIAYSGFTDSVNLHPVNTKRIWGKLYPFIGIAEENATVKMQSAKLLEVSPNPARSFLAVRLPQSTDCLPIKIFDVSGKLVKTVNKVTNTQSHKQEVIISLKGINPGIYFLRFGKENKKFLVVK